MITHSTPIISVIVVDVMDVEDLILRSFCNIPFFFGFLDRIISFFLNSYLESCSFLIYYRIKIGKMEPRNGVSYGSGVRENYRTPGVF